MTNKNMPINKGNYTMDTQEREQFFEQYRGEGWQEEYRQYRTNWSSHPKNFFVSEYPLLVDIELSSICNLKCPMCYTITDDFKQKVEVGLMDFSLFTKIIDEIAGKVPAIRLSLRGEPTLHPKFIDCIIYAKQNGIKEVSTLTNGSMLSDDFVRKFVSAGLDWLTISVDGVNDTYEKIRFPLKFEQTLAKIKSIKKIKQELNVHRPVVKIQSIWPAIRDNPSEFYNTFVDATDLIAFNPLIDYLGNDEDIIYEQNFSCPQLYQRVVIGSNGKVLLCSNDEENSNIIGDVNVQTVKEIWHGEKLNRVREIHKQTDGFLQLELCRKCYLPRKTEDNETACVNGREFIIQNYVNRKQNVGE